MGPHEPPGPGRRPRVLLSAFACVPGRGSEPGAGWTWALAATVNHDVVLLTERENERSLTAELAARPVPALEVVYVDVPAWVAARSTGDERIRLRNAAWQRAARRTTVRLHRAEPFDVVHHVTWSADWQPVGVAGLGAVPFVWGPVGGAGPFPWQLTRWFTPRALVAEAVRWLVAGTGRRALGDRVARAADVVLCQNDTVAARFRPHTRGTVRVEPNVGLDLGLDLDAVRPAPLVGPTRRAVFAARIHEWKGLRLAIAALAQSEARDWQLVVVGDGPARAGGEQAVAELGLVDRVSFTGALPRPELLQLLAGSDALLFPSMHEACGWVVAEALALGCPPVCLDVGGPPVLIRRAGFGAVVPLSRNPAPALAKALAALPLRRPPGTQVFSADRLPALLADVYAEAGRVRGTTA